MVSDRLDRRPEARSFSVEDLLHLVRKGEVRVPEFQRPFRWKSRNIVELFDSIYRGFPIGGLLFSRSKVSAESIHFGPVHVSAPEGDAYLVIDGQQRVTALAATLLHPDCDPRQGLFAIWFDLEKGVFQLRRDARLRENWIPLNVVWDSIRLHRWVKDWPYGAERPDLVDRAFSLGKAIREYHVPAYIVVDAPEPTLRLLFKRINTTGLQMEESEVFDALYSGRDGDSLRGACARLEESGFGPIDREWFVRSLRSVVGLDPRGGLPERLTEAGAVSRTEDALRHAIEFLTADAGILHVRLLPYRLPLIVLAKFFDFHPMPGPRNRTLLARWIWRGALTRKHEDSSRAAVDALQSSIDENESASTQRLLGTVSRDYVPPRPGEVWNPRSASTRLAALALLALHPRDPTTGEPLDQDQIGEALERGHAHLFRDVAEAKGGAIARRIVSSRPLVPEELHRTTGDVLGSLALDTATLEALRTGRLEDFAAHREQLLSRHFDSFFREVTGILDSDRPPISSLVDDVELRFAGSR